MNAGREQCRDPKLPNKVMRFRFFFIACFLAASAIRGLAAERLSPTNLLCFVAPDGSVAPGKTVADWQKRRAQILDGMRRIMGPLPGKEKRCPLDVKIVEEVNCGDYVRREISY